MFCSNCTEVLSSKKRIVVQHGRSLKHKRSKEEGKKSTKKVQTMADALKRMDASQQSFRQTLPMDMRVWRMQVLTRFMSAGIPRAKIDQL